MNDILNDNMPPGTPPQPTPVAIQEMRFVVDNDGGVKAYVLCKTSEGIIGVDGWHFKKYPPGSPLDIILAMMFTKDPFTKWPLKKPDPEKAIMSLDDGANQTPESPHTGN